MQQNIFIVTIASVSNTDILKSWTSLMLSAVSNHPDQVLIVTPYSKDKIQPAIDLFHQKHISADVLQIPDSISYNQLDQLIQQEINNLDGIVTNVISIFNPCQGNRLQTTDLACKSIIAALDNSDRELPQTPYMIEKSSCMLQLLSEILPVHNPEISFHHLCNDPQEVRLNDLCPEALMSNRILTHFVHGLNEKNSIVNPFILYDFHQDLTKMSALIDDYERLNWYEKSKQFEFVFGLTGFNDERRELINQMKDFPWSFDSKFYYYYKDDQGNSVDTRVPYDEYLQQIDRSMMTLVVPAYDETSFSVHRFVESLSKGCIPIVYQANNHVAFDDETNYIIDKYLKIHDINELTSKIIYIKGIYKFLLRELLNTPYMISLRLPFTYQQAFSASLSNLPEPRYGY